jgi:hypothetical protein
MYPSIKMTQVGNTQSYVSKHMLTQETKKCYIHDNGGRPFKLMANDTGITIYKYNNFDIEYEPIYDEIVYELTDYSGFWEGYDTSCYEMHGNSVLIQVTDSDYIYVGWNIYKFSTNELIVDYVSPVGNNDVPYPVAYGVDNVYFMLDNEYISKTHLNINATIEGAEAIYAEFYGHYPVKEGRIKQSMLNDSELVGRVY